MTASVLRLPRYIERPSVRRLLRMCAVGLGMAGQSIGLGLGTGRASAVATPWYRAGGAPEPIAVYQPIGAASLAASYVNLVNPGTYNAAPGTAPTFASATGWTFAAASSQYLATGIVPASGWSALVRFSHVESSNDKFLFASRNATGNNRLSIQPSSNADTQVGYASGQFVLVTPAMTSGVLAVAGQQGYRNGVADGGAIAAWDSSALYGIFIGARNLAGVADAFINAKIQALAIYNTTMTAAQVAAVSAAMAALTG